MCTPQASVDAAVTGLHMEPATGLQGLCIAPVVLGKARGEQQAHMRMCVGNMSTTCTHLSHLCMPQPPVHLPAVCAHPGPHPRIPKSCTHAHTLDFRSTRGFVVIEGCALLVDGSAGAAEATMLARSDSSSTQYGTARTCACMSAC